MDNEECCDLYPWVEPVYDYHDKLTTVVTMLDMALSGWEAALNTNGDDSRGDYWLKAYAEASSDRNRWRNIADDWQRAAEHAMDTARLGLWILLAVGAVAAILIIVKVLQ